MTLHLRASSLACVLGCLVGVGLAWQVDPAAGERHAGPPRQDEAVGDRSQEPWEDPGQWSVLEGFRAELPTSITVRTYESAEPPLRAWLVTARPDAAWQAEATLPAQGLRTTSSQAEDLGALVAVNAGFFARTGSVSTVVDEGELTCCGPAAVTRKGGAYPVTRAAIGFDAEGAIDCAWTWCFGDTLHAFDAPLANVPGTPAEAPTRQQGRPWQVEELVGGGPMLVSEGALACTEVAECFQSLGGSSRHPRTAAGWTRDGALLLLVVDGRSALSRGATLEETGRMLRAHGAHEALNLDGGGSTTLWIAGEVRNAPSDRSGERAGGSVLALVPRDVQTDDE